ncbi:hypothetical protein [Caulobacter sp. NIBR1757]|uniref:hypothetical protein n=1 Tax=Caulobacter sp. NIBR1757 TaxID=3016000 RepID=UPI0022F05540|nr:hypothetical protein [Caulobacter sp. NIBR1757]WGM40586.1 hypothetical protein AMEJIAPC_03531 [Caulobacter sp. NIBR1757]
MYRRRSDIWFERTAFGRSKPVTVAGAFVLIVGIGGGGGLFWLSLWLLNSGLPGWLANVSFGLTAVEMLTTWIVIATHTGGRDEIEGSDIVDEARRVLRERRDS